MKEALQKRMNVDWEYRMILENLNYLLILKQKFYMKEDELFCPSITICLN